MKSFKTFLLEKAQTHSTHLEDLVIDMGSTGARTAIKALEDFKTTFSGSSNEKINLNIKIDGAPAVAFGYHPETGEFFVGTKSTFNPKNPKFFTTASEVDEVHSGDLADKLKDALKYLKPVTPKGRLFQGDFLYSKKDLKYITVNGENNVVMHPNTIAYSTPADSDLGKRIINAQIGLIVHTEYSGGSLSTLTPSFGVTINNFKTSKDVYLDDAEFKDIKGYGNFTKDESTKFDKIISDCKKYFKSTSSNTFKTISSDRGLNAMVAKFNNQIVRAGNPVTPKERVSRFQQWVIETFDADISKLKTESGKIKKEQAKQDTLNKIDAKELESMFALQQCIADGKKVVLDKLAEIQSIGTFVQTKDGYKLTGHEGYVGLSGDIKGVKLVDRLEFSHNNFSSEVIKAWAK